MIYLARHGETAYNAAKRFQGHLPVPLNDRGREQARELAEAAAEVGFATLLWSMALIATCTVLVVLRQSIGSRRYGVRLVRHGPGSALALLLSFRYRSAHSLTVSGCSGRSPSRNPSRHALLIAHLHQRRTMFLRQHLMDPHWVSLACQLVAQPIRKVA